MNIVDNLCTVHILDATLLPLEERCFVSSPSQNSIVFGILLHTRVFYFVPYKENESKYDDD